MQNVKERYFVRYMVEDNLVEEKVYEDRQEALLAVVSLDCEAFNGVDAEEYSMYAEAQRESDGLIILWANTEGERGTNDESFENVWKI